MFERLKRLYDEGKIYEAAIRNAVEKGWLTEEQANEILNPSDEQKG
ncbi:MAG: XkdX family protein [Selenomonadaceae bacterium]|nr:XkdX family protein [Selenomonadaceae bacterium]